MENNNQNFSNNEYSAGYSSRPAEYDPAGDEYQGQYSSVYYSRPAAESAEASAVTGPVIRLSEPAYSGQPDGAQLPQRMPGARALIIVALCVLACVAGFFIGQMKSCSGSDNGAKNVSLSIAESPVTDTTVDPASGEPLTYAQIAASMRRAVVGVNVYASAYGWGSYVVSEGSGFIISDDGYIITNSHVIDDDKYSNYKITVNIEGEDGSTTEHDVTVIGYDVRTDLAVLKLNDNVSGLVVAELGDSTALVLGDEVVAIGNPGGSQFAGSVTNGIVSGVDRVVGAESSTSDNDMKYIQTNAAINPGNSGGPLLNMYGQVIGINSAKIVASGYEGLGFAIPMDKAKPIVEQLIAVGSVVRPTLGGTYSEISERMSVWYDVPVGLMIRSINPGSKLEQAGAAVGDIIISCNGEETKTADDLQAAIEKSEVGEKVTLRLFRSGTDDTFEIEAELVGDNAITEPAQPEQSGTYSFGFGW